MIYIRGSDKRKKKEVLREDKEYLKGQLRKIVDDYSYIYDEYEKGNIKDYKAFRLFMATVSLRLHRIHDLVTRKQTEEERKYEEKMYRGMTIHEMHYYKKVVRSLFFTF